jgi:hypothetical protein
MAGGIFGTIGGIIGAAKQKKASKKAQKAQMAFMEKGIGEQRRQFDLINSYYDPYRQAGQRGLTGYENLLGTSGPEAQAAAIQQLQESPYYQSLYGHGLEANLQNASATGGIRGGNEVNALADFGRDTLAQTIDHQLQGLGNLTGVGQQSIQQEGEFGAHTTDAITQLLLGQGQAKAGGILTRGGLSAGIWQGLGSLADTAASAVMGGMGGFPGLGGSAGAMPSWLGSTGSMPLSLSPGLGATGSISYDGP